MSSRIQRASKARGSIQRSPFRSIIGGNIAKGIFVLGFSFAVITLSMSGLAHQNTYIDRISRPPKVDSWSASLDGSHVGSFLVRHNFLDRRQETGSVAAIKASMPGVFEGFFFGSVNDLEEFASFFYGQNVRYELKLNELRYGIAIQSIICNKPDDLESCRQDAAGQMLDEWASERLVDFLTGVFDDLFFSKLDTSGAASVRDDVKSIAPIVLNGDFPFFTPGDAPQYLSKWLIIVGFFEALDGQFSSSFGRDISLFYTSPVDRIVSGRIVNPALRTYRSAIESFYMGCFDDAILSLRRFRSLTDNPILVESSIIFEGRALARPLFMNYLYWDGDSEFRIQSLGPISYCGKTVEHREAIDRALSFFSPPVSFRRIQFRDDYESLRDFVEGYDLEFRLRTGGQNESDVTDSSRLPGPS